MIVRRAGERRHYVELQAAPAPSQATTGYVADYTTYAGVWARVTPAPAAPNERPVAETTQAPVSHLVELDYRPEVRITDRVRLDDARTLYVVGLQNVDERNKTLVLACEERLS